MEKHVVIVNENERKVLRELASQYMEIAKQPKQEVRRELWRKHNNLEKTAVPVICSWLWSSNTEWNLLKEECVCKEGISLFIERWLRNRIFHDTLNDDMVLEPWMPIRAILKGPENATWGEYSEEGLPPTNNIWGENQEFIREGDSWQAIPFVTKIEDIDRIKPVQHQVDEKATKERLDSLEDIFGDIMPVSADRRSIYISTYGGSDISEALGKYIGIEKLFYMVYDNPEIIHKLASKMQKAILASFDEAEKAGDFFPDSSINANMGMPYCEGMPDPIANRKDYRMKELWYFAHGQEFTSFSPKMHKEFLLDYQIPILEKFGLTAYACCEDVTNKIDILKKIPNLRRIGVPPVSDVKKCAEQIEDKYVMAWRPNPANVIAYFDADEIRKKTEEGLEAAKGCVVDIMLKDITAVGGEPERLKKWTDIVKNVASKY